MSKKKLWMFNINIILITMIFLTCGVLFFLNSYYRMIESIVDLYNSFVVYVWTIIGLPPPASITVHKFSNVFTGVQVLPPEYTQFKVGFGDYFRLLFNGDNFRGCMLSLTSTFRWIAIGLMLIIPIIIMLIVIIKKIYYTPNNKHGKDTIFLQAYKFIVKKFFNPIKEEISEFVGYIKNKAVIWKIWIVIWLLNFNLITVIIGFLAFYLYFAISLDMLGIYTQFCKLTIDLKVIFNAIPLPIWIVLIYIVFNVWRKKLAIKRLRHFEARNCGFIKELPIVSIACGSMGKKKTTLITDMTLSQEVMFIQKAFDILQRNDAKFPNFPWIRFEKQLQKCIEYGTIYNLATVKEFVNKKRVRFENHHNIYEYDYESYGLTCNNGLYNEYLFDVLETYGQAYFIYILYTSLITSNYSISTDNELIDRGNFPMWASDFFPKNFRENSKHSHVLDFDILRLGKKVIENNPNAGSFEFGVVAITEIGKERANNLELQEIKKNSESANQKNDLFNAWLKMCRHSATVDNYPFIKVFTDEQRPESWGADARDLCEIIRIAKSGEQQLALPFYGIEEILSMWFFDKVMSFYYDLRFNRGDNTLLVHLLKGLAVRLFKRNVRMYNRYGYSKLFLEMESGTMTGKIEKRKYYLMNGKIYRKRFSTDCFSDYFNELAKKTNVGLNDYREYLTEKASVEELKLQNSYFIKSLYKDADGT